MKYQSEIIAEIVEKRGHEKSSLHYESECKETWIKENEGAYPKLTDYEGEWLNYINENPIGKFPYHTVTDVTEATIENVVPYAYKSAILKGLTLVNLANYELSTSSNELLCSQDVNLHKNNTTYTLFNFTDKPITFNTYTTSSWRGFEDVRANSKRLLTLNNFNIREVMGRAANGWDKTTETEKFLNGYMIIEGDYTNVDIPYFNGMQSVKMPILTTIGKNLFDGELVDGYIDTTTGIVNNWSSHFRTKNYIKIIPNTKYVLNKTTDFGENVLALFFYDINKNFINVNQVYYPYSSCTSPKNAEYVLISGAKNSMSLEKIKLLLQLEEGSTSTSYEPYKSNILTVNEEVELCGIGDIKDELDLSTGELSQRIGEIVLNGSEASWTMADKMIEDGFVRFYSNVISGMKTNSYLICDKLPQSTQINGYEDTFECVAGRNDNIRINVKLKLETLGLVDNAVSKESIDIFKSWLKNNNLKIKFELATESIKTVDLTITNQDGKTVQFKPIEGTMHLETSSDTINPTFSGEIPVEAITQNLASFIEEE